MTLNMHLLLATCRISRIARKRICIRRIGAPAKIQKASRFLKLLTRQLSRRCVHTILHRTLNTMPILQHRPHNLNLQQNATMRSPHDNTRRAKSQLTPCRDISLNPSTLRHNQINTNNFMLSVQLQYRPRPTRRTIHKKLLPRKHVKSRAAGLILPNASQDIQRIATFTLTNKGNSATTSRRHKGRLLTRLQVKVSLFTSRPFRRSKPLQVPSRSRATPQILDTRLIPYIRRINMTNLPLFKDSHHKATARSHARYRLPMRKNMSITSLTRANHLMINSKHLHQLSIRIHSQHNLLARNKVRMRTISLKLAQRLQNSSLLQLPRHLSNNLRQPPTNIKIHAQPTRPRNI